MSVAAKFNAYARLMRADKPIGIYLLLWPTMWALLIAADGVPPLDIFVIFVLGVVVMRSAGCVINDYADRHVDGAVERTAMRPIVAGEVAEREALFLFSALIFIAFVMVMMLNWQTIALSVGALILAASYPFMKRYTHLPQVVLGAAFGWSIPMAFMAVTESLPWWAWAIFAANLLWTVAYDTMYAMVDRNDDLKIGVKSTAILFGQYDRLIIGVLQLLTLIIMYVVATALKFDWPFFVALTVSSLLFAYQQWLIKDRARPECFTAFLNNHYVGMVLTAGIAGHYLINS